MAKAPSVKETLSEVVPTETIKVIIPFEDHPFHKVSDTYLEYLRSKAKVAAMHSNDPILKELSIADVNAADAIITYRATNQLIVK